MLVFAFETAHENRRLEPKANVGRQVGWASALARGVSGPSPSLLWFACVAALVVYAVWAVVPAAATSDTDGFAAYYAASRILLVMPSKLANVFDDAWFQERLNEFVASLLDAALRAAYSEGRGARESELKSAKKPGKK